MIALLLSWILLAQVEEPPQPSAPPAEAANEQDAPAQPTPSEQSPEEQSPEEPAGESDPGATTSGEAEPPADEEIKMADPPKDVGEAVTTVWSSVSRMWEDFLGRLPLFVVSVIVLVLTWLVASLGQRLTRRALRSENIRGSLKDLIRQFIYIGIWLSGLMIASIVIFPSLTPTKVLTVLGLSSIAIGFAFKDIVENFFAGILILWGFPFENGDFIECDGIKGKVEETTIRMTTLRQVDGQLIIVPNAQLFKSPVYVLTSQRYRRTTIIAGVAYDEDVDQCREIITKAVEACESVAQEKPVQVFAQEFGASSINFEVTWWTGSTPVAERKSRDEVVAAVKRALDEAGVEIPFPYRTLTFKEPLPVLQQENAREGAEQ